MSILVGITLSQERQALDPWEVVGPLLGLACCTLFLVYVVFPWFEPIPEPDQLQVITTRIFEVDPRFGTRLIQTPSGPAELPAWWLEISLEGYSKPFRFEEPYQTQLKSLSERDAVEVWLLQRRMPGSRLPMIWQVRKQDDNQLVVSYDEVASYYSQNQLDALGFMAGLIGVCLCLGGLFIVSRALKGHLRRLPWEAMRSPLWWYVAGDMGMVILLLGALLWMIYWIPNWFDRPI